MTNIVYHGEPDLGDPVRWPRLPATVTGIGAGRARSAGVWPGSAELDVAVIGAVDVWWSRLTAMPLQDRHSGLTLGQMGDAGAGKLAEV